MRLCDLPDWRVNIPNKTMQEEKSNSWAKQKEPLKMAQKVISKEFTV